MKKKNDIEGEVRRNEDGGRRLRQEMNVQFRRRKRCKIEVWPHPACYLCCGSIRY